jgi:integrase
MLGVIDHVRAHAIILVLLRTGMRFGELRAANLMRKVKSLDKEKKKRRLI